ncbi:MAG: GGDEF domain-containing protein [Candidatus Fermentibacteria bacterium]|nr:GGDEF domain-containing protein [Candidatus Fermentibacteria bacterium]
MQNRLSWSELENLFVLRGVSCDSVVDALRECPVIRLSKGEVLIRTGQNNQSFYIILSGKLAIYLEYPGSDPIAVLDQGETVGELSVIDDSSASAYVVGAEDSRLLEVDETAFWQMISESHAFACNMLLLLSNRMRTSDKALLGNIRMRKRFQHDAMFDSLTEMHNRRWLDVQLPRLINRHIRSKSPLCIVMFDIDHFKKYNDSYGHDAGDCVLAQVSRTIMQCLRPTDLSARFGGEEFVIMLSGVTMELAWIVAERLRKAIAAQRVVTYAGGELPAVTVSMGIAESRMDDTADSFLKRADIAMYKAKNAGRNRTCRE